MSNNKYTHTCTRVILRVCILYCIKVVIIIILIYTHTHAYHIDRITAAEAAIRLVVVGWPGNVENAPETAEYIIIIIIIIIYGVQTAPATFPHLRTAAAAVTTTPLSSDRTWLRHFNNNNNNGRDISKLNVWAQKDAAAK